MSFFVYLAVLIVAGASALFGLDLLTAPLPPVKPNAQGVASNATAPAKSEKSDKLDTRGAEQRGADKQASNSDRALSPVYPASPSGTKPEVRMVYPPTNDTTGTASAKDKRPAQPQANQSPTAKAETKEPPAEPQAPVAQVPQQQAQQPAAQPQQNQAQNQASVAPRADQPATPTEATTKDEPRAPAAPVTQQTPNRCDVQACAGAYSSFRVSDCTYQPFAGPRRVCEAPPAAQQRSAERARPNALDARAERLTRQARRDAELRDVVRSVRELTARDARDDRDDDDDAEYDAPVAGGRRVIILQRSFGWR